MKRLALDHVPNANIFDRERHKNYFLISHETLLLIEPALYRIVFSAACGMGGVCSHARTRGDEV